MSTRRGIGLRVRNAMEGHLEHAKEEGRPEAPGGQNPPRGALLDYYPPAGVTGPVTLDIVSGAGKVIRSYSSEDPALTPDPALDPDAYNQVCQQHPEATDCGLPLYWPAPQARLSARAGMHRFEWDMRYQPIGERNVAEEGDVAATGAVPHRSVHGPFAPWAPPGRYTVRPTVAGRRPRRTRTWGLDLTHPGAPGTVVWDRSSENRYADPGRPLLVPDAPGRDVLQQSPDGKGIYLAGAGASPTGEHPFLARFNLDTKKSDVLFQSVGSVAVTTTARQKWKRV